MTAGPNEREHGTDRDEPSAGDRVAPPVDRGSARAAIDGVVPRCPKCGYRLNETPAGAPCPECGHVASEAARRAYAVRPGLLRRVLVHYSPLLVVGSLWLIGMFLGSDGVFGVMVVAIWAFIPWILVQSTIAHYRAMRRRALLRDRDVDVDAIVGMLLVSFLVAVGVAATSIAMFFGGCLVVIRMVGF